MNPAFIVELAKQKRVPEADENEKLVATVIDHEEQKKEMRRVTLQLGVSLGVEDMLKPWNHTDNAYMELQISEQAFMRGHNMIAAFLNEYPEEFGLDEEFRGQCTSLLEDLRSRDPKGEDKVNAYIQNMINTAMRADNF